MTDFFQDLADDGPVAREIKRGGKSKTVHFRKVTAGERLQLVKGQKMTFADGKAGAMEMDLADITRNRHMLVQFSCVTEDGEPVFSSVAEVGKQPNWLINALATYANEVNEEGDEGKA